MKKAYTIIELLISILVLIIGLAGLAVVFASGTHTLVETSKQTDAHIAARSGVAYTSTTEIQWVVHPSGDPTISSISELSLSDNDRHINKSKIRILRFLNYKYIIAHDEQSFVPDAPFTITTQLPNTNNWIAFGTRTGKPYTNETWLLAEMDGSPSFWITYSGRPLDIKYWKE